MQDDILFRKLAAINAKLDALLDQRERQLSREDCALLTKLLPVVEANLGPAEFTSADLLELSGPALVLNGASAKKVGQLLQRAEGIALNGIVVERVRSERGSIIWRLARA